MLRSVIRSLADEGRTILMSSHVIEVVEQLCTDVVILSDGNVVAHDRVDRLRRLQKDQTLEHVFVKLAVREKRRRRGESHSRHRKAVIKRLYAGVVPRNARRWRASSSDACSRTTSSRRLSRRRRACSGCSRWSRSPA